MENPTPINLGSLTVDGITLAPESLERAISLAANFILSQTQSLGPGDFAPIVIDNSLDSHIALLAFARAGINSALIDSRVPSTLFDQMMQQLEAKIVFFACKPENANLKNTNLKKIFLENYSESDQTPMVPITAGDGTLIIFSSGSTGSPKGVKLSWRMLRDWSHIRKKTLGSFSSAKPTIINFFPMSWSVGLMNTLDLFLGFSVHYVNPLSYSPRELLTHIAKIGPNVLFLSANLAQTLAQVTRNWTGDPVNSIDYFQIGSGPLDWSTVNAFKPFIGERAEFVANYSATEALRIFIFKVRMSDTQLSGQIPIGKPRVPENVRLRQVDNSDFLEVLVSGEISSGYLDSVEDEKRYVIDKSGTRWWISGDLVQPDSTTGLFFHKGRRDELVRINDHQVSLVDLESQLKRITNSQDVAALAHPIAGRVRLVAVAGGEKALQIGHRNINKELSKALPKYSLPHSLFIIDALPKTLSGKIDKPALRTLVDSLLVTHE